MAMCNNELRHIIITDGDEIGLDSPNFDFSTVTQLVTTSKCLRERGTIVFRNGLGRSEEMNVYGVGQMLSKGIERE